MKKKCVLFVSALVTLFSLSSCEKHKIEDTTKFTTKSIIGTWVAVNSQNKVLYYYVIKDDKNLLYVDGSYTCLDCDEDTEYAIYDPSDGYMHSTSNFSWTTKGDLTYTFDESKQVIRCHTGILFGFNVKTIIEDLGSDEIFEVDRRGLNEAMIYDKTGLLLDAHIYRIKGEKRDLSKDTDSGHSLPNIPDNQLTDAQLVDKITANHNYKGDFYIGGVKDDVAIMMFTKSATTGVQEFTCSLPTDNPNPADPTTIYLIGTWDINNGQLTLRVTAIYGDKSYTTNVSGAIEKNGDKFTLAVGNVIFKDMEKYTPKN